MTRHTDQASLRSLLQATIKHRAAHVLQCPVRFVSAEPMTENFTRIVLAGDGLSAYTQPHPADAFKLHFLAQRGTEMPAPHDDEDGRAVWPTGHAPWVRCFTVTGVDPAARTLSCDLLTHPDSRSARWITDAIPGDMAQLTGFRTEFVDPSSAAPLLLVADSSALPALISILVSRPHEHTTTAIAAVTAEERTLVPASVRDRIRFIDESDRLPDAVAQLPEIDHTTRAWVCGESTIVRTIRRHLLDQRQLRPDELHAAGYWRRGEDWEHTFERSLERFNAAAQAGQDITDPQLLQRLAFDPLPVRVTPPHLERNS